MSSSVLRGARLGGLSILLLLASSRLASAETDALPPGTWLEARLTQDFPFVGGSGVCTRQGQLEEGFACFRASGSQYHGTPIVGQKDEVNGGFVLGTTRAELGIDYALWEQVLAGARFGYVLRGGGPPQDGGKKFLPFSAELHLSYWFLGPAHRASGIQPYASLKGGIAEIDGAFKVTVVEDQNAPPPPNQPDNPPVQELDGYKKLGSGFAGIGVGAYLPAGREHGPSLELSYLALFPTSGNALTLSLGYAYGI